MLFLVLSDTFVGANNIKISANKFVMDLQFKTFRFIKCVMCVVFINCRQYNL